MKKPNNFKVTYKHIEPKTPEEKNEQQRRVDEVFDSIFDNILVKANNRERISMDNPKKELENLKTEIAGLKVRIRRIENYLLNSVSDPAEYIHEDDSPDELLEEAKNVVRQYDRASASLIQRRLSIGYSRAARILDQLEAAKVVGSAEGSKPREVYKNVAKDKK